MDTHQDTLTIWQSGRLAPQARSRSFEISRERWLEAGLLALSAVVMAVYVSVLQHDVDRNALQRAAERSRAVAEAQCESEQPADQRGRCIALFNGDEVAATAPAQPAPANVLYEQENAARAMTVSMVSGGH
jgi:hypothetical protein